MTSSPDPGERRRRSERDGRIAEAAAAAWLWTKGYRILARRVRTRSGEIDLIARKSNLLVFVEVKSRTDLNAALHAVTPAGWRRIARAADLWAAQRPGMHQLDWRYDLVAAVGVAPRRHIRDAWRPDVRDLER